MKVEISVNVWQFRNATHLKIIKFIGTFDFTFKLLQILGTVSSNFLN